MVSICGLILVFLGIGFVLYGVFNIWTGAKTIISNWKGEHEDS